MRNSSFLAAGFLAATSSSTFLGGTALAGDRIDQVAMGERGDDVRVVVWTSSGAATPESVQLQLSPYDGAPAMDEALELTRSSASQQTWLVPELRFDRDARGQQLTATVSLWDAQAALVDQVELVLTADGLTRSSNAMWGSFGAMHGHLDLEEAGDSGRMGIVVSGPDTARVSTVSIELDSTVGDAAPTESRYAAQLEVVQQLWTRTIDTDAAAGDRYQVDGIVVDGRSEPYGTAFVTALTVGPRTPSLQAPSAWPVDIDGRLAVR